eukprot:601808-Amphidinium_carterae.1
MECQQTRMITVPSETHAVAFETSAFIFGIDVAFQTYIELEDHSQIREKGAVCSSNTNYYIHQSVIVYKREHSAVWPPWLK